MCIDTVLPEFFHADQLNQEINLVLPIMGEKRRYVPLDMIQKKAHITAYIVFLPKTIIKEKVTLILITRKQLKPECKSFTKQLAWTFKKCQCHKSPLPKLKRHDN